MSFIDRIPFFDSAAKGAVRGARRFREIDLPEPGRFARALRPGRIMEAIRPAPRRDLRVLLAAAAAGAVLAFARRGTLVAVA